MLLLTYTLAGTGSDERQVDTTDFASLLTYPYASTGNSLVDGLPSYFGNNQAEACPMALKRRCSPHQSDCPDDSPTRCCEGEYYCEFPPFEEENSSPTSWFPESVDIWNGTFQLDSNGVISRRQILERALGWVSAGFEYKWQGDRSGSKDPLVAIESCYEGQEDCPRFRLGSTLPNNQGPDCCTFASMAWNIKTGASCLRRAEWSKRIDCADIQPGDAISSGKDSRNDAPFDEFPKGAHIYIFREWIDKEAGHWSIYQLGGGWGKTNAQTDEAYGEFWSQYDPENMYCMERLGVYDDNPIFTKDNGDRSCDGLALMDETECMEFATATINGYHGKTTSSAAPKGCYLASGNNHFYYGGDVAEGDCTETRTCFCKPFSNAVYTIADSEYPSACDSSPALTEDECKNLALSADALYGGFSEVNVTNVTTDVPPGCYKYESKFYWNDYTQDEAGDCTDDRQCYCKTEFTIAASSNPSACDSSPALTEDECKILADSEDALYGGFSACSGGASCVPPGCYKYKNGKFYWNDYTQEEASECSDDRQCYCKKGVETVDHLAAPAKVMFARAA